MIRYCFQLTLQLCVACGQRVDSESKGGSSETLRQKGHLTWIRMPLGAVDRGRDVFDSASLDLGRDELSACSLGYGTNADRCRLIVDRSGNSLKPHGLSVWSLNITG